MMFNLEKPIKDLIFQNKDIIHKFGFISFLGQSFRQYELPSGKKIDMVTHDTIGDEIYLNIIEIKKDDISTRNGIMQAYEYAAELTDSLFSGGVINTIYLKVILVGYKLKNMPIIKFMTFSPEIYTYNYDAFTGLKFTQQTEGGVVLHKTQIVDELLDSVLK